MYYYAVMTATEDSPSLPTYLIGTVTVAICTVFALLFSGLLRNVETFLKVNICITILMGLSWLLAPVPTMKTLELATKFDGVHMWLALYCGIMILYSATCMFVCLGSDDNTVTTSLLWSGINMVVMSLMNVLHWYDTKERVTTAWTVTDIYYSMDVLVLSSWLVGIVCQLRRLNNFGGYTEQYNWLNIHLRVDAVLCLIIAVSYMAFHEWNLKIDTTLKSIDTLHLYLGRSIGIMYTSSAIFTGFAPKFMLETTKTRLLLCRFVAIIAGIAVFIVPLQSSGLLNARWFFIALPFCIVWAGNALAAVLFSHHDKLK